MRQAIDLRFIKMDHGSEVRFEMYKEDGYYFMEEKDGQILKTIKYKYDPIRTPDLPISIHIKTTHLDHMNEDKHEWINVPAAFLDMFISQLKSKP